MFFDAGWIFEVDAGQLAFEDVGSVWHCHSLRGLEPVPVDGGVFGQVLVLDAKSFGCFDAPEVLGSVGVVAFCTFLRV